MEDAINIAKSIGVMLGEIIITLYICIIYVKKHLKKPDISKKIVKQNSIDLTIVSKLDYAKEVLNADYIHLYEFHNGEHYADWRSSYKFSCSYEVVKAGKQPIRNKCLNLPIAVMPKFIREITSVGYFICTDLDTIKNEMINTYAFAKALNINCFYNIAIHNTLNNVIGFISIIWTNGSKPNINVDEIKKLTWLVEESLHESIQLTSTK